MRRASVLARRSSASWIRASALVAALTCRPPRGALDLASQDLAGRSLGQLVDDPDGAGVLVGGQALLGERLQLLLVDVVAVLERDRGADLLAQVVVLDADHGDLGDGLVLVERLLDLARVDVVAAADDQVLLAVDDEEVAVLVLLGHVAGEEPAVLDGLLGVLASRPSSPSSRSRP